ncbi:MAG TPA: hypothetical protein VJ798_01625, partial [Rhizomicrobium sp.]|nr:hypothetical protein [Rhizomicrobium sp.]
QITHRSTSRSFNESINPTIRKKLMGPEPRITSAPEQVGEQQQQNGTEQAPMKTIFCQGLRNSISPPRTSFSLVTDDD